MAIRLLGSAFLGLLSRLLSERRRSRHSQPSTNTKATEKIARRDSRELVDAANIPPLELKIQEIMNDTALLEYLQSHPWPLVIPGPPSMQYTAYDHIIAMGLRRIELARSARPHELPNHQHLGELQNMLRLLKEQVKQRELGLMPDSPSDRKMLAKQGVRF